MIGVFLGVWMAMTASAEMATAPELYTSVAQGFRSSGTAIALPTGEEFYDEVNDTYYLLFEFQGSPPHTQEHAAYIIKGYRYKEREGYLASIKEPITHFMITGTLFGMEQTETWIGLIIECGSPVKYYWEDKTDLREQEFRAWAHDASERSRRNCRGKPGTRLPVYYVKTDLGMRWQVGSERDNAKHILVAFPNPETRAAEDAAKAAEAESDQPSR